MACVLNESEELDKLGRKCTKTYISSRFCSHLQVHSISRTAACRDSGEAGQATRDLFSIKLDHHFVQGGMNNSWKQRELVFILLYAAIFYIVIIHHSLQLSHDNYNKLYGLRPGLISSQLNDVSDAQWRNFRSNLPILTFVFGLFILMANTLRACYGLKADGMSIVWLLISLAYLSYLHGAFIFFILAIASTNFFLVKIFGHKKYFPFILWVFNLSFLLCNRVYEGYSFASFGLISFL